MFSPQCQRLDANRHGERRRKLLRRCIGSSKFLAVLFYPLGYLVSGRRVWCERGFTSEDDYIAASSVSVEVERDIRIVRQMPQFRSAWTTVDEKGISIPEKPHWARLRR